jgi:hypothetical protein
MLFSSLSSTFVFVLALTNVASARPLKGHRGCAPRRRPSPTSIPTPEPTSAPDHAPSSGIPNTIVIEGEQLATIKAALEDGTANDEVKDSLSALLGEADGWLDKGPWSVMDKPDRAPNSTDKHDYYSMARYFWPSPGGGCPYVSKDGESNPEAETATDRGALGKVSQSIPALSFAWFYSGKDKYSEHAAKIIRTWFIDEKTRMRPHLQYAQAVKCSESGRFYGIVDFSQYFTSLLDAVRVLESGPAPGWTDSDSEGFKQWSAEFYDWLSTSDFGKKETKSTNNHGTFADLQRAGIALFLDKKDEAKDIINSVKKNRVNKQIKGDGTLPQELERTRPYHYTVYTLTAYTRLAMIADKLDIDLWGYEGPDGQSIRKAIEFVLPYATDEKKWKHKDFDFKRTEPVEVIFAAAAAGFEPAKKAKEDGKLKASKGAAMFAVRPAPEI